MAAGGGLNEAEKHASQGGLAAAGFAHEPKSFTLSDIKRDAVHGADFALGLAEHAFVGLIDLDEVADGEQGHSDNIQKYVLPSLAMLAAGPRGTTLGPLLTLAPAALSAYFQSATMDAVPPAVVHCSNARRASSSSS